MQKAHYLTENLIRTDNIIYYTLVKYLTHFRERCVVLDSLVLHCMNCEGPDMLATIMSVLMLQLYGVPGCN